LVPDDPYVADAAGASGGSGAEVGARGAGPAAGAADPADGRLIADRYRVVRRLGGGGMAEVFLARDTTLDRLVAVKVLRERFADDQEFVARFHREARAAAALNHPNVVAIHDRGGAAGSSYIVMEYVSGETLKERIGREGRLSPAAARAVECDVLGALQAAHDRGIVHRDVTAQNVLLAGDGRVKVADFGIAHFGSSALTSTGVVMGTSRYLSPEQARGEPTDKRSDVYSAGVVLFEMLTGRLPFEGDNDLAIALRHASEPAPAPSSLEPGLSPALDAIVGRALRKDPGERFQTAQKFAAALNALELGGDQAATLPAAAAPSADDTAATRVVAASGVAASGVAAGNAAARAPGETAATRVVAAPAVTKVVAAAGASGRARAADGAAETAVTRVVAPDARDRRAAHRRRRLWALLGALIVIAAATAGFFIYRAYADRPVAMPYVVGMTQAHAAGPLRAKGFAVRTASGYSDAYAPGVVMAQRPVPGSSLKKGQRIRLVISRGLLHPAVVSVVGQTSAAAAAALKAQSFVPTRLSQHSTSVPKGKVIRQSPAPGTATLRGSAVSYWVSSGPPKVPVPYVVGVSEGNATNALKTAGFAVQVKNTFGLGAFPGNVTKQAPAAGVLLPRGAQVTIWVAVF
jgi:eukaryotic-like serine/threonine-protein kinase